VNKRTRRVRTWLLLGVALLCAGSGLALQEADALRRLDLSSVDARFDVRGPRATPEDVVIVGIDDQTLNTAGIDFPFSRKLHAKVIRNLVKADATVISYDVQFSQESGSIEADNALILAVRSGKGRVVLAATAVGAGGVTQIFGGGRGLRFSRARPGYSNFEKDDDGVTRRLLYSESDLKAFPIASAEIFTGREVAPPPEGADWIDFEGGPETFAHLSFVDVLEGNFDPADVRGKIAIVGDTSSSLHDVRETSTTNQQAMAGPEVHANAITTTLAGFPLRSAPDWVDTALVILLGVLAPLAAIRLRMLFVVPLGILAIAGLLVGAQIAFEDKTIVTFVYALIAGVAALLLTGAIHGITVAFERAHIRESFSRFVPEAVVDEVLKSADGLRLGGVQREGTVMFSDLRGFTSFAETLQPAQVIDALNRYLTAMSEAILDHGGTLVAYMGDGIMAVFGAPLQQPDHADRALAASRDMLERLEGFNQWLRETDMHDGFKMGIGLNSGPVMSGHVGSERRLEYTALGDTTNTAARLEGMTKGTPHQLFLADSTRAALRTPADDLVEVGEFEVRGRKATIKLWSLAEPDLVVSSTEELINQTDDHGNGRSAEHDVRGAGRPHATGDPGAPRTG
jgi:adenylate cyclase